MTNSNLRCLNQKLVLANVEGKRKGVVVLDCRGQLGNRLGQYVIARLIADTLNFGLVICNELEKINKAKSYVFPNMLGISYNKTYEAGLKRDRFIGHRINLSNIFRNKTPRRVEISGYPFLDYSPFGNNKQVIINDILKIDLSCITWQQHFPKKDDIVIHLRTYRTCKASLATEPDYTLSDNSNSYFQDPPYEYYKTILDKMKAQEHFGQIWLVSRCGLRNKIALRLTEEYGCKLSPYEQKNQIEDFLFIYGAMRIIMAPSTYSWWSAYLSNAREIHYPLLGDWWGGKLRHCMYPDEERYIYHVIESGKPPRYFLSHEVVYKEASAFLM